MASDAVACVLWVPRAVGRDLTARVHSALREPTSAATGTAIVLTNAVVTGELDGLVAGAMPADVRPVVLGPEELSHIVDARPELWLAMPSLLGVRRLDDVVAPEALAASRFDLAAARALAPAFVPTRAYRRARRVLERHGFAVLAGPPEMGKTAAARMIALARLCRGWEVHECTDPDQVWAAFRRDRGQVFVADDAFGSTEYQAGTAERWALDLHGILTHMDGRHWLIWTSRPAPLAAGLRRVHREHGLQRFPKPGDVMVDAADLTIEERALMLYRHAAAADLPVGRRRALMVEGDEIAAHPHLTPERVRRFVSDLATGPQKLWHTRSWRQRVAFEIARPTDAMGASLDALDAEHRDVLVAMLDVPPGPVPERELAAGVRRHGTRLGRPMPELVDRLADHFLRPVSPASVTWVHPSWRDLVIDRVERDPERRQRFLERCGMDGLLLALSTGGGPTGDRALPMLVEDADWDALLGHVGAVVRELDSDGCVRLLRQLTAALRDRAGEDDERARSELDALTAEVLRILAAEPVTIATLPLLEEWHVANDLVSAALAPPDVGAVWAETLPTELLDLESPDEIQRLAAWTSLAAILRDHDPTALTAFGFPWRQSPAIGAIFDRNPGDLADVLDEAAAFELGRTTWQLSWLFPMRLAELRSFASAVAPTHHDPDDDPEAPPRYEVLDPGRPTGPSIVRRVLQDLDVELPRGRRGRRIRRRWWQQ